MATAGLLHIWPCCQSGGHPQAREKRREKEGGKKTKEKSKKSDWRPSPPLRLHPHVFDILEAVVGRALMRPLVKRSLMAVAAGDALLQVPQPAQCGAAGASTYYALYSFSICICRLASGCVFNADWLLVIRVMPIGD